MCEHAAMGMKIQKEKHQCYSRRKTGRTPPKASSSKQARAGPLPDRGATINVPICSGTSIMQKLEYVESTPFESP